MKTYKLWVSGEFEIAMLELIQKNEYRGLFWPHSPKPLYNFELDLDEPDLLVLLLQIPCKVYE